MRLVSPGPSKEARLHGRGGCGVQWQDASGPAYLIVRDGVAKIFRQAAEPVSYIDTVGLFEFVRQCLHEQIESIMRVSDPPPLPR